MLVVSLNAPSPGQSTGADLIVFNGHITTQNLAQPEASAPTVKRGRIFSVGNDAEI
jgi:predicted amidohydrolase YtcJ